MHFGGGDTHFDGCFSWLLISELAERADPAKITFSQWCEAESGKFTDIWPTPSLNFTGMKEVYHFVAIFDIRRLFVAVISNCSNLS